MLGGLGALMLAMVAAGVGMEKAGFFGGLPRENMIGYVVAACGAGLAYAGAVAIVRRDAGRQSLLLILAIAGLLRVLTFATPPLLSTDIFRYVWDGRVQAAGINPYLYVPAAPELGAVRDPGTGWNAIYANINRADSAHTIYPPGAQALFAGVAKAWSSIWGIKLAMLLFDLVAIGAGLLLLRAARQPLALVLIYAWNPLPIWEFGGAGHIDAAATGLGGLALLAAAWRRPSWAGAALAGAVLCKLLPAALFPAIWRRWDWRAPLVCAVLIAAGYAAYAAGAGWGVLGYLPGYANEEGLGGSGFLLVRLAAAFGPVPDWAELGYLACGGALLVGLAAWIALRGPLPAEPSARAPIICRDATVLYTAAMFVLSPHYPWYLSLLALPAVLAPARGVLWLTISAPVLYLDDVHDNVLWPAVVFLPFIALLVIDLFRAGPQPVLAAKGS